MTLIFGSLINHFGTTARPHVVNQVSEVSCWMVTGERQATRIRGLYMKSILRQDIAFFDTETNIGEVIGRMSRDTILIQDAMGEKVGKFIQLMSASLGGFAVAFTRGWLLALVLLSCVPPLVITGGVISIMMSKLSTCSQASYAEAGHVGEHTVGEIRTVACFNGEKHAIQNYDDKLKIAYASTIQQGLASGLGRGIILCIVFSIYGLAIWYGSKLITSKGYDGKVINDILAITTGGKCLGQASAIGAGQAALYKHDMEGVGKNKKYTNIKVETDLQSGAEHKYELLWIILSASISALIIQSLAANFGVVTGKHLAEHCKNEYPTVPNFILWIIAEIGIVACDIPEVIGTAFALNMLFNIPVWCGVLLTGLSTLVLLALQQYGVRKLELLIAFLVLTITACFFVELGYAKPNASEVLHGLFVPQLKGDGATGLAISLLGAMVMPHNLFLHSALVLSRKIPRSIRGIKEACRFYMIESGFALMLAFLINVSIISVSGSVCNSSKMKLNPEDQNSCEELDLNKASFLLRNVLGRWSSKIFAIALLASGQSSTVTGTYAGQYVMQGFLNLRLEPWVRNFLTRSLAIVPSLVVALVGGSAGAGELIIISSMILSFELPFALIPLLKFTSSKAKMGSCANSIVISAVTWIIGTLIMAINMFFLGSGFIKLVFRGHLKVVAMVFAGFFGVAGMLLYLAAIAYLVFRKNRETTTLLALTTVTQEMAREPSLDSLPREDIVSMQLPRGHAEELD